MAHIADLLAAGKTYSFEFFPPKTPEAEAQLNIALEELEALNPSFVSVTYGAGGTTREPTRQIVRRIHRETSMSPMAHLSCVSHSRNELIEIIRQYSDDGIENILALAGDPTDEDGDYRELPYASDLVDLVQSLDTFSVGVAAHPYGHPKSSSLQDDRRWLAHKLRTADFAITQFFFEVGDYLRLVEELNALDVDKPVIPGIMPVTNVAQVERFAALSGAPLPDWLVERLHAATSPEDVRKVGVEVATDLCRRLLALGAPGLHFYTLNRSTATREIFANLTR